MPATRPRRSELATPASMGLDGELVDAAHMRHAANILEKATLISGSDAHKQR